MNEFQEILGDMWTGIKDVQKEAKAEAERRNKLLHYPTPDYTDNFAYPPTQFYEAVLRNVEWRKVPDLKPALILMRERHVFSKKRLYLQLKRERLVFEICAAPFGTGYFVSSRLFDRRHDANLFTFIVIFIALGMFTLWFWANYGVILTIVAVGTIITLVWSLMRYAIVSSTTWLDEQLCELPIIGPLYETLFHPETYFRQDTNMMYRTVVDKAFKEALKDLKERKGIKAESPGAPKFEDLHQR